jgi:hypothetical protein
MLATPLLQLQRSWLFKHRDNFTENIVLSFIPVPTEGLCIVNSGMKINFSDAPLTYAHEQSYANIAPSVV